MLGALEPDEARAVEELAQRDPDVASAIEDWQKRLAPLAAAVPPRQPPPELWRRIEQSIGGFAAAAAETAPAALSAASRVWRNLNVWRAATLVLALAAAYAGFVILTRPEPTEMAAALIPAGSPGPTFLAQFQSDGSLAIRPLATAQAAPGKDMELWALPEGAAKPVSLGVLPAIGRTIPPGKMPPGPGQLMVSLEPQGGSPTGEPTGPVLYSGTLKRL